MKLAVAAFALAVLFIGGTAQAQPIAGTPIDPCGKANSGQSITTPHPTGPRNWICREQPAGVFNWHEVQ